MISHLYIAFGLLVAGVFVMRGLEAIAEQGFSLSLHTLYILGGFVIAGFLIRRGLKLRQNLASANTSEANLDSSL